MDTIAIYSIYSAISCLLLASGLQIYIKLRSLIKYRVNCWFCNCNSKVSYNEKIAGWNCQHCEQYNGFSSDGDYNRDIPEQYIEQLNGTLINKESHTTPKRNNILCQTCTHHLEIKVKLLANFRPVDENDFDKEVERFSNFLEQAYPLCDTCEQATQKTINEKDAKLIGDLVNYKLKSSQKNKSIKITNLIIDLVFKLLKCSMLALANILFFSFIPESAFDLFPSEHIGLLKNSYDWINLNMDIILISILVINLFLVINIKLFKAHITPCILWLISLVTHHYHIHYIEKYLIFTSLLLTYVINIMSLIEKKTKTKKIITKIKKKPHIVRRLHEPRKSVDKDFPNLDSLSLGSRENFNNSSTMNANFLGGNPLFESYRTNKINNIRPRQTLLAQPRLKFHRSPNNSNNHWASTLSECDAPSRSSSQSSGIASLADLDTLSVKSEPIYQNNRLFNQSPPLSTNKFLTNPRSWSPAPGPVSPSLPQNCPPQWSPPYQNYTVLHVAKNWNTPTQSGFHSHWSPPTSPWSSDPGSISSDSTSSPLPSPYFPHSYPMITPKETFISYLIQSRLFLLLVGLLFIYNIVEMFVSGYHAILLPLIRLGPLGIING